MGLSEDHSRDCYSLLLPSRDVGAFNSNILVKALALSVRSIVIFLNEPSILEFFDLRVEVRLVGRLPDIVKSGTVQVVLDVVADGIVEKSGLLADDSKGTSEVMDIVVLDIHAVDQYLPAFHVVEPLQQLVDRRLAAA